MELEGGIVDEDIQPAELLHRLRHRLAAGVAIADVGGDRDAAAAFGLDGLAVVVVGIAVLAEIGDGDVGALRARRARPPRGRCPNRRR